MSLTRQFGKVLFAVFAALICVEPSASGSGQGLALFSGDDWSSTLTSSTYTSTTTGTLGPVPDNLSPGEIWRFFPIMIIFIDDVFGIYLWHDLPNPFFGIVAALITGTVPFPFLAEHLFDNSDKSNEHSASNSVTNAAIITGLLGMVTAPVALIAREIVVQAADNAWAKWSSWREMRRTRAAERRQARDECISPKEE